ncbi:PilW family protein [Ramlibacter rhizophilus]|uniref:Pilus assembly protein PilW n=1 Tax=Ramlibacter rhizophilus TaxID=1781167 RepID=A0A4Z0BT32_9BURK|nr:PilW family protein [Ramlibacter rhizophilus]TFZ01590.1 pilus assembly protein PilW [Ramlibacter rhizophilus]
MTSVVKNARSLPRLRAMRGVSLVEVMVGLTIGMLLVAGLALMFGNASRANSELDKSVRHIENGRYALDLLTQEISLAGYYGTVPATAGGTLTNSPCQDSTTLATALVTMQNTVPVTVPAPVQGFTPAAAASLTCIPNYKSGTPVLAIRRLDTATTAIGSLTNGVLYVQTSHNQFDNYASYKAAVGSGSNATNFNLKALPPAGGGAASANPARRFISRIYYIANCNDCSGAGDGIPTLRVSELNGATFTNQPLAEGIDQIGFDFGIDDSPATRDGVPDTWYGLNGPSAGATETTYMSTRWVDVVAVRISLVSRSPEFTAGWSDVGTYAAGQTNTTAFSYSPPSTALNFKRRGYVTTIRLNNWAGLRES